MAPLSDEELARQAQAGELAAFEDLITRHHARVFRFLCQKAPTQEDAEDLTQQTFITAHRRIHQFRLDAKFVTWLFTIARRLAINHHRARAVRPTCELAAAESLPSPGRDPAWTLAEADDCQELWRAAREALVEPQYAALWLFYREHMPIESIARVMNRSQVSVKVLLHRARKRLAGVLPGPQGGSGGATGIDPILAPACASPVPVKQLHWWPQQA